MNLLYKVITKKNLPLLLLITIALGFSGCAPIGYLFHVFTADSAIKAVYKLPKNASILIMVDDPKSFLGTDRMAKLAESEANYLLEKNKKDDNKFIPESSLTNLANRLGKQYSKTAVTTIGKTLGADIVIHAEIIGANLHYTSSVYHPTAQVRVKVIDVLHNTRLFPSPGPLDNSNNGYALNIEMDYRASDQNRNEANKIATRKLSKRIGSNLAKLFYDHGERRLSDEH